MPDLTFAEVGQILRLLQSIDGSDVDLEWGDLRLRVRHEGSATTERDSESTESESTEDVSPAVERRTDPEPLGAREQDASDDDGDRAVPEHWDAIESPMVGTFYRAPKPGEPAYVEVGDVVAPGDTVGLVEVMKLFTELKAEVAGKVARVEGEDAALVEFGEPLIWIEPA